MMFVKKNKKRLRILRRVKFSKIQIKIDILDSLIKFL